MHRTLCKTLICMLAGCQKKQYSHGCHFGGELKIHDFIAFLSQEMAIILTATDCILIHISTYAYIFIQKNVVVPI